MNPVGCLMNHSVQQKSHGGVHLWVGVAGDVPGVLTWDGVVTDEYQQAGVEDGGCRSVLENMR